jgi:hypothetical protein
MKKIILVLTIGLLFLSCSSPSNDSSSSSSVYKWSFKLDGVLYEWSGGLYDQAGQNYYRKGQAKLLLTKENLSVNILFPNSSTGNFIINNSTWQSSNMMIIFQYTNMDFDIYETSGSIENTMNVNVSSISTDTNPLNPGKTTGTFSGTIQNPNGQLSTITNGVFEVRTSE